MRIDLRFERVEFGLGALLNEDKLLFLTLTKISNDTVDNHED